MAYSGSVEVVSGLKQKNGANFPIVEASAIYVSDDKRLSDIISGFEKTNIKEYVEGKLEGQDNRYTWTINDHENRLLEVEKDLTNSELVDLNTIKDIIEETERATLAEENLSIRIEFISNRIHFSNISNDSTYADALFVLTDNDNNVLAYFDNNGDFHVNGNIYVENW